MTTVIGASTRAHASSRRWLPIPGASRATAISSRNSPHAVHGRTAWLRCASFAIRIADTAYTPSPSRGSTRRIATGASATTSVVRLRSPAASSTTGIDHSRVDRPRDVMPNTSYTWQQSAWISRVNTVTARGSVARRCSPGRSRTPLGYAAPSGSKRRRTGASRDGVPSAGIPPTHAMAMVSLDLQLYSVPTASTASGMRTSVPGALRRAAPAACSKSVMITSLRPRPSAPLNGSGSAQAYHAAPAGGLRRLRRRAAFRIAVSWRRPRAGGAS